jgi:hypothetical protein
MRSASAGPAFSGVLLTGDASRRGTHKAAGVPLERISEALAKEVKPLGIIKPGSFRTGGPAVNDPGRQNSTTSDCPGSDRP